MWWLTISSPRMDFATQFLLDIDGTVSQYYDIFTTPTTYFVDPDGVIAGILPGVVSQN